jgi:TPR repeat protein
MYLDGIYVNRDSAQARALFMAAAQQGNVPSYLNLARCHLQGCAGPPDDVAAYGWFLTAKKSGRSVSAEFESMFAPIAARLSSSQLSAATTSADQWQREHVTDPLISNVKLDHVPAGNPVRASRASSTLQPTMEDEALTQLWLRNSARQHLSPPNSVH